MLTFITDGAGLMRERSVTLASEAVTCGIARITSALVRLVSLLHSPAVRREAALRPAPAFGDERQLWRLTLRVFLPFAAAYYLSYLFRTINAASAPRIAGDLGIGAAEIGLLTAVYFLTFAAAQLPIGAALDRFGPRRVQLVLLPIAVAGAVMFAASDGMATLLVGRALIGFGVAACLVAGLKALVLWLPKERLAFANGCFVAMGALGAVCATFPADAMLDALGWRGLFVALAAATLVVAGAVWWLAPAGAPDPGFSHLSARRMRGLGDVLADRGFWRIAPMSACCIGTAFALQGLWVGAWLADVGGLERAAVMQGLLAMAMGLFVGALLLGMLADRLRRHGITTQRLLAVVAGASMVVQTALVLRVPLPPELLWALLGAVGGATGLGFASLAEIFPKDVAGRANGALNMLHIGAAFLVQTGIGFVVALWPVQDGGHYSADAYIAALTLNLVPQAASLAWFLMAPGRARTRVAAELAGKAD